jgi:hypothetical protein
MKTTKRGRPFLKVLFLPSPSMHFYLHHLPLLGHPRSLRNSRRFPTTHNTQAVLPLLPKFILHVRLSISFRPFFSFRHLVFLTRPSQR